MRLGDHAITVLDAPFVTDEYGNEGSERDWDNASESLPIDGCSVQGQPSSEFTTDRDSVLIRKQLFAPVDTPLTASSRVRFDGALYDVDGEPQRERHGSPTDHLFALLRRTQEQ